MKFLTNKGFIGIIILIILGAVSTALLGKYSLNLDSKVLTQFAFGVTLVPGLLWLIFFYLEDKYEKEPIGLLLGIFVAGGIAAFAIAKPFTQILMPEVAILEQSFLGNFVSQFLIEACIEMLVIFMVVRYTVYFSKEFNEPADGLIYTIAAGLGFAATYNILYISGLDAINPGVVLSRMISFYLVIAIFSGIMGYFIGIAKFSNKSNAYKELLMLIGFLIAVLLNAVFFSLLGEIQGMSYNVWTELLISSGVVIILYILMYALLHRSVEASPFKESAIQESENNKTSMNQ
jgi:RsiW-degrading membrane proteinase PrsW (M82 family)